LFVVLAMDSKEQYKPIVWLGCSLVIVAATGSGYPVPKFIYPVPNPGNWDPVFGGDYIKYHEILDYICISSLKQGSILKNFG